MKTKKARPDRGEERGELALRMIAQRVREQFPELSPAAVNDAVRGHYQISQGLEPTHSRVG